MKYKYCDECPDCLLTEPDTAYTDDDGWSGWSEHKLCKRANSRYLGSAFAFETGRPMLTSVPGWCPLNQENYEQEIAEASEKAKSYGGTLIKKPLDPKRCWCEHFYIADDDPYLFQSDTNCFYCIHSSYITVNEKSFWLCRFDNAGSDDG